MIGWDFVCRQGLSPQHVRDATSPSVAMILEDDIAPCWSGDIDIAPLKSLMGNCGWSVGEMERVVRGMDARHDHCVDVLRRT